MLTSSTFHVPAGGVVIYGSNGHVLAEAGPADGANALTDAIQAAGIGNANSTVHATIDVGAGIYNGGVTLGSNVTLFSSGGAAHTTINGSITASGNHDHIGDPGHGFTINGGVTLDGEHSSVSGNSFTGTSPAVMLDGTKEAAFHNNFTGVTGPDIVTGNAQYTLTHEHEGVFVYDNSSGHEVDVFWGVHPGDQVVLNGDATVTSEAQHDHNVRVDLSNSGEIVAVDTTINQLNHDLSWLIV